MKTDPTEVGGAWRDAAQVLPGSFARSHRPTPAPDHTDESGEDHLVPANKERDLWRIRTCRQPVRLSLEGIFCFVVLRICDGRAAAGECVRECKWLFHPSLVRLR